MIKDAVAKLFLVPLLGISIALLTGCLANTSLTFSGAMLSLLFWIGISFFVWQGIVITTAFIRNQKRFRKKITLKVFLLLFSSAVLALLITSLATLAWNKLFQYPIPQKNAYNFAFAFLAIAPIIGLSYEIHFLKKEQELDSMLVELLDYERQFAELQALNSELDPHFMFNALNVLSPLITVDAAKAQVFTIKLAQVYKYLLRNKDRDLVTLSEELRFIQDYFFLLQIRHENKLHLILDLQEAEAPTIMILPFALQLLVENAIKHNEFSDKKPLVITISQQKQFIEVRNTINKKPFSTQSTHVGLKNLSSRYKLICNKDIIIYHTDDLFLVKLPLVKKEP
jgi:two-component system, LytTR family, sensor kinase